MSDIKYTDTFQGLLDCEYYSIGVTGAEALVAMLDDYNEGRLTEFLAEQGVNDFEFLMTVNRLAVRWASNNELNLVAGIGTGGTRQDADRRRRVRELLGKRITKK
jgi:hypothetical protein